MYCIKASIFIYGKLNLLRENNLDIQIVTKVYYLAVTAFVYPMTLILLMYCSFWHGNSLSLLFLEKDG